MTDPVDLRFFNSLQKVLAETEAVDPACRAAVERALATGRPDDMRIAREHVHALPNETRDQVLGRVHAAMASDLSAIWDMLPGMSGARKVH